MNPKNTLQKTFEVTREQMEKLMNLTNGKVAEEVSKIIGMSPKEFESFKMNKKFEECINTNAKFHMFDKEFFEIGTTSSNNKFKTMYSIGAVRDELPLENFGKTEKSHKNFATNYKSWLGEKLHLTKEEIEKISIDELDAKVGKYLTLAITHVNNYMSMVPDELQDQCKSEYYSDIHETGYDQRTVHNLLVYFLRLGKEKEIALKQGAKDADIIRNNSIAQFEIQRLLALAVLFRDREENHEFQHVKEDESFIKGKLVEIFADKGKPRGVPAIKGLQSGSGLYDYTTTKTYYVTKKTDGSYIISETKPKIGKYMKMNLDGTQIQGFTDYFRKKPAKIEVKHIMLRSTKNSSSSVDKFIMKEFSSFTEILDQKGLIIVLNDYKDAIQLEKILENELGTKETSWVEKLEFIGKHNHNSSESYSVKKGILKLSYKAKDRKARMKSLKEDIQKLETQVKETCSNKDNIEVIDGVKKAIEYLKNRLKNLTYNIEVEIQIFDVSNYIKAEIDKDSPAYHGSYKKYQKMFDLFPKYFPKHIYGEECLKHIIMPVIEEKFKKEGAI